MNPKDPDYIFAHKIYVAIEEYDKLGADDFKTEYGFGKATTYALELDGKQYPPKAIYGLAWELQNPGKKFMQTDSGKRRTFGKPQIDRILKICPSIKLVKLK